MPRQEAWVERSKVTFREGLEVQAQGVGLQNFLITIKECFARANICN